MHRWCCDLLRVSHLEAQNVHLSLPGAVNLITWSRYCLISTLYYNVSFFPLPFNLWGDTLRPHKYSTPEQNYPLYLGFVNDSCWSNPNYDDCKMIFEHQHSFHIYQLVSAFYRKSLSSSPAYLFISLSFYCQYEFINSYIFSISYNLLLYLAIFVVQTVPDLASGSFSNWLLCPVTHPLPYVWA